MAARAIAGCCTVLAVASLLVWVGAGSGAAERPGGPEQTGSLEAPVTAGLTFPAGPSTPSEVCGACHVAIYGEFAFGFGGDQRYRGPGYRTLVASLPQARFGAVLAPTAHALASVDPPLLRVRKAEARRRDCDVCHYPRSIDIPSQDSASIPRPEPRPPGERSGGVTCASCHLAPDGSLRAVHEVQAPHRTTVEPRLVRSVACAPCHADGRPAAGKQYQTFFEWRADYLEAGLGSQQCQDCHMPRTLRKTAEAYPVPERPGGRHLWPGGHSAKRVASSVSLTAIQPIPGSPLFVLRVANIGAAHSVPTGTSRRALRLRVQVYEKTGRSAADRQWFFAPWPADRGDDRTLPDRDASQRSPTEASGPGDRASHWPPLRAGEERVLTWNPPLRKGAYVLRASLAYDLDRFDSGDRIEDTLEFENLLLRLNVQDIVQEAEAPDKGAARGRKLGGSP